MCASPGFVPLAVSQVGQQRRPRSDPVCVQHVETARERSAPRQSVHIRSSPARRRTPAPSPGNGAQRPLRTRVASSPATFDDSSMLDPVRDILLQKGETPLSGNRGSSDSGTTTIAQPRTSRHMKSTRKRRTRRVRSSNPPRRTFQSYMDEVDRTEMLEQAQVLALARDIRASVKVQDTIRKLEQTLGRRPTVYELAQHVGCEPDDVQKRLMTGTAAKNTLVSANLRLVSSVARKLATNRTTSFSGITLEDMIQEGSVGLIRAAEKFDGTKGYRFSTYATWWIRAFVMRGITEQSRSIKVPGSLVDDYSRIRKEYRKQAVDGPYPPSVESVARALGITPAKLRFVVQAVCQAPLSLDIRLNSSGDSNGRTLGELVEGDDDVEEHMVEDMQRKELDEKLKQYLRPLERAAVRLRFGLDDGHHRTLREVGELLNLSSERIRQLIYRALAKLNTPQIRKALDDYLC